MLRQFDRRESRTKNSKPRIVVETHESKIVGTLQSHLFDGLQKSNGHEMVRNVNPVGTPRQQSVSGAKSGFDAVVAFNNEIRIELQSTFVESIAKSAEALFCIADAQRTADEPDAFASGAREMTHSFVCALVVVADDGVFCELWVRAHEQHERNVYVGDGLPQRRLKISGRFGEHDSVDAF